MAHEYKVGDKVRVVELVASDRDNGLRVGTVYTVREVRSGNDVYTKEPWPDGEGSVLLYSDQIEPAPKTTNLTLYEALERVLEHGKKVRKPDWAEDVYVSACRGLMYFNENVDQEYVLDNNSDLEPTWEIYKDPTETPTRKIEPEVDEDEVMGTESETSRLDELEKRLEAVESAEALRTLRDMPFVLKDFPAYPGTGNPPNWKLFPTCTLGDE